MEVLALIAVLWRRKLVVVASVATLLLAAAVASLVLPESYEATCEVVVAGEESASSLLNDLGLPELAISLTNTDDLQNRIYETTSRPVIDETIWKMQIRDGEGRLVEAEDVAGAGLLAPLLGNPTVSVSQVSGTDVLEILASAHSPEAASLLADTVADVAIARTTAEARTEITEARDFVREQLEAVTTELDRAFSDVAEAQRNAEIIDVESEVRAAVARLSDLLSEQTRVASRISETRARIATVKAQRAQEGLDGIRSTTMTENPVLGRLRSQLSEFRAQRQALLLDNHTELAPEVRELDFKIRASEREFEVALKEMAVLDPVVAGLEADLAGLQQLAYEVRNGIDTTTSAFSQYPEKMRRISRLELAASAAEDVYRSLQDQRFQIGVAEAMTMSDIRVLSRAVPPESASSPKVALLVLAALILGLALGTSSAFALDYVDDSISTPSALREAWASPQLGLILRYRPGNRPVVSRLAPTDPLVEQHRLVRTGIGFAAVDSALTRLGITSSIPGEGKSTLAVNLAISYAKEGKRTLLVDADLRKPTQHQQLSELVSGPGLVEVLTRSIDPNEAIQGTDEDNLFVLTAGELPPNPSTLVESLRMRQVLLELEKSYDILVVDMPPVLAVGDALVLGHLLDGMLVVVESGRVTRRMLLEVAGRFEAAGLQPIGLVLNKLRSSASPYATYSKYYAKTRKKKRVRRQGGAA